MNDRRIPLTELIICIVLAGVIWSHVAWWWLVIVLVLHMIAYAVEYARHQSILSGRDQTRYARAIRIAAQEAANGANRDDLIDAANYIEELRAAPSQRT